MTGQVWATKSVLGPGCVGELQCSGGRCHWCQGDQGAAGLGQDVCGGWRPHLRRSGYWSWLSCSTSTSLYPGDRLWCTLCCAVGGTKVKINLSGSLSSALLLPWPPLGWARREHTARHGRGGRLPPAAFIVISANMCVYCVWIPDWCRCVKDHSECDY